MSGANIQLTLMTTTTAPAEVSLGSLVVADGIYSGFCAGAGIPDSYNGSELTQMATSYVLPLASVAVPAFVGNTIAKYGWGVVQLALKATRIGGAISRTYGKFKQAKEEYDGGQKSLEGIVTDTVTAVAQEQVDPQPSEMPDYNVEENASRSTKAIAKAKSAVAYLENNEKHAGKLVKAGGTILGGVVGGLIYGLEYGAGYAIGLAGGIATRIF